MGFSIDDIIRTDHSAQPYSPSPQLPAHLPTTPWLVPLSANNLYHFHRQSVLQYFRHRQPLSGKETKDAFHLSYSLSSPIDSEAAMFLLNSFRKPKRNRTAFTPTQLLKLEDAFEKNHYIVGDERKQLARHLNLSETKVSRSIDA